MTVCGVGRGNVEREPGQRPERLDAADDARHADVAEHDQPRRLAQVDAGAERGGERPRHEVDRDEPGPAVPGGWRGQ